MEVNPFARAPFHSMAFQTYQSVNECLERSSNKVKRAVRACFSKIENWAMDHPNFTMCLISGSIWGVGIGVHHLPFSRYVVTALAIPWYLTAAVLAGIATCPISRDSLVMSF